MRRIIIFMTPVLLLACGGRNPAEMKNELQGYWQIEKVEMADGSIREFRPGANIDYFEVTGDSGVRKKVSPQIDGRFAVNKSSERFYLEIRDDSLIIQYKTPYNQWEESVLKAEDSSLVLMNSDKKRYYYKKFRSFDTKQ